MNRDYRYGTIHVLIESGHISSFRNIFEYIPKTVVYKDLHVNFKRFSKAVHNPAALTMDEIFRLADMFSVDRKLLVDMAYEQSIKIIKKKAKKTIN